VQRTRRRAKRLGTSTVVNLLNRLHSARQGICASERQGRDAPRHWLILAQLPRQRSG
jgi:hypothetical protein